MTKIWSLTILCLAFGVLSALGNSVFAPHGPAVSDYGLDAYSLGMGGTGSGDFLRLNTGYGNPALAATVNETTFSTAITSGWVEYNDGLHKYKDDSQYFPYFNFVIPVKNHRIGFSYQSVLAGDQKFTFESNDYIPTGLSGHAGAPGSDTLNVARTGTVGKHLWKASVLWAYHHPLLEVGVSADYYFSQDIVNYKAEIDQSYYKDTQYERGSYYKNPGLTLGVGRRWDSFSWGLSYAPKTTLDGDTKYTTIHSEETVDHGSIDLPHRFTGGVALKTSARFKLAFDGNWEGWGSTNAYEQPANSWRLAVGAAWEPEYGRGSWYEKIPVRTGLSYRTLPFKYENNLINETAASVGISVPLSTINQKLDLGFTYSYRAAQNSDYSDTTYYITLGTTGFDIFRSREKRTAPRDIPRKDNR